MHEKIDDKRLTEQHVMWGMEVLTEIDNLKIDEAEPPKKETCHLRN